MELTLITWNIHKGIGGLDRRYKPERIIQVLDHYKPDFVFLQEVDEDANRSLRHRQVELFGDALGLKHRTFSVTHKLRSQGQYGNAVLSRWPLDHIQHMDLTIGYRKKRGAILARARLRLKNQSHSIALYNLHLGLAGSERDKQLAKFLDARPFLNLHQRTPVIVGGDFNDLWGTLGERFLEPAGFRRAVHSVNTFPSWMPARPLDAIFSRGEIKLVNGGRSKLKLAKEASDHIPLIAKFKI
ncbi:endonuclease/exonuclease/phosphatase family protein [Myxococcota bacterium]|nr:endonuclease/exonuclease/phosphatase family protein [Myxococcota bacterium]